MKYMLDTNICIYMIKKQSKKLLKRIQDESVGDICISSITASELWYGVEKSNKKIQNTIALKEFISLFPVIPFEEKAAEEYGNIRAELENSGKIIGGMDLLIAAHARSLGQTLVSNNTKEFKRVRNLLVDNWTR
ncbi:MAG: type II toxin-antitoxin system VapC family toxin [Melioribacteraceae bacterium]|nr:type II toxin-antitoxin system VapC family toxin [Melioribacteraceae bacterium]MCF8356313.1 type II toxin-antitoxin system VapC family toxin [Melioribacteraceae bacterium]MCF8394373.1 type II toxin-antitoxin system VapC family toxin [Melioribacteraceae bacterium]MCF8420083.1 type II toxin-antitoxin system VapC family toxin [Melioribacteraceae bacterium]